MNILNFHYFMHIFSNKHNLKTQFDVWGKKLVWQKMGKYKGVCSNLAVDYD